MQEKAVSDKPKRPLSAYFLFTAEHREKVTTAITVLYTEGFTASVPFACRMDETYSSPGETPDATCHSLPVLHMSC